MKREDIEKAAGDYSGSILGFRDNESVMAKHKAFADGAEWRIKSVWHDWGEGSNMPDIGELCLVEFETDADSKYYQRVVHADKLKGYDTTGIPYFWNTPKKAHIISWAYIEDLLPNKED